MTTSERLLARLRAEGVVPAGAVNVDLHRTHASGSQRVTGAWSWVVTWGDAGQFAAGSQWPMAACLRAQRWETSHDQYGVTARDTHVDPSPEDRARWREDRRG